jgi:hypothetical protein
MTQRIFLNNPLLLTALSGLYPALFFSSNNWFLYKKIQIATLLLFTPLFAVSTAVICYAILYTMQKVLFVIIPKGRIDIGEKTFRDYFFTLFSCAVIFFLLQKTNTTLMPNVIIYISILAGITVGALFAVYKFGLKPLNIFLLLLVSLSAIQWLYSYYTSKSAIHESLNYSKNKSIYDSIRFNQKPNIYLIVLESYHNNEAMKTLYNFNNQETEEALLRKDFVIYQNTYSNYWNTLGSILAMFTMHHHYYNYSEARHEVIGARNVIGGQTYNPVLTVLGNNGYKKQYILISDYMFFAGDPLDYAYPQRTPFKAFEVYQVKLLDDLFCSLFKTYKGKSGQEKNKDRIPGNDFYQVLRNRLPIAAESPDPYFTFIKIGLPGHFWKTWNLVSSSKNYLKNVKKADSQFMTIVDLILKKDKGAFIILIGDHGAWRYREVWAGGEDIHKTMKKRGVQEEVVTQDLFGTFLAVKYPKNCNVPRGVISHVNLFRYVFSSLSENGDILKTKVADESYAIVGGKRYIAARDGKPLKRWIRIHQPNK